MDAKLAKEREALGFFKTPLTVCRLFATATMEFLATNVLRFATSKSALFIVYPLLGLLAISVKVFPSWYASPDVCDGSGGGWLYGTCARAGPADASSDFSIPALVIVHGELTIHRKARPYV